MPFKVSVAQGHNDLLNMIRRYVTGQGEYGSSSYSGTGNGTISSVNVGDDQNEEVWTITAADVTTPGAEVWTVTGSVSGLQDNAITGVEYDIGKLAFLITAGGTNFILGDAFTVRPAAYTGTGNGTIGTIDATPSAIDETWTITCTDATTAGAEVWSVVGSVSGAQASATTAVAYSNTYLSFTITAGGTNFAVNDAFTIDTSQSDMSIDGRPWAELAWDGTDLYLKGQGLDGTKEIFTGIRSYENVGADYYNLAIMGATGYLGSSAFGAQPGSSGQSYVPTWNQAIPFRLYCNGQRIILHAKIETVFVSFYLGFIIPFATPGQFPYPLVVGGTNAASSTRYNSTSFSCFFRKGVSKLRFVDGLWINLDLHPDVGHLNSSGTTFREGLYERNVRDTGTDQYVLTPIVLLGSDVVYGEFDGVAWITGFNNAVENTLTDSVSAKKYFMTRDSFRTGFFDYAAIEDK